MNITNFKGTWASFHNGTSMYDAANSTNVDWDNQRNYTFNASESQIVYASFMAVPGKTSTFTAEVTLRDRDKSSDDEDEEVALDKEVLDAKPLSKRLTWNEYKII